MEPEEKMDSEVVTETETDETQAAEEQTDETQLATEALAVTEEEEQVPAAVVGGLRRQARAAELEAAELRGKLAARDAPVVEKSPLELEAEEQGVSVNDVVMDGALYQKQKVFEDKRTAAAAEKTAAAKREAIGAESYRQAIVEFGAEKMGEGLDYETILSIGAKYLTSGDKLDIAQAGGKCAQLAYKRCRQRIAASGTADAKTVAQRFAVHKKAQAKLKEKQPGEPEGGKPPKIPSQDDILNPQLDSIFGKDW